MIEDRSQGLDRRSVIDALERVLHSDVFASSPRSRDLLAFVVTETVDGRGDRLNQRVVARVALGRPSTMDSRTDASARVQASRVRALLERYYAGEGLHERARISIPLGQYGATFLERAIEETDRGSEPHANRTGPTVAVLQLRHGVTGLERRTAAGLSEAVVYALARCPGISVLGPLVPDPGRLDAGLPAPTIRADADYVLHGGITRDDNFVRVSWHLSSARFNTVAWSETFAHGVGEFTGFGAEDEILRKVIAAVGDFSGAVLRASGSVEIAEGSTAAALRRYYAFMEELDPVERGVVIDALTGALDSEPHNAHVAACLAFAHSVEVLASGAAAIEAMRRAEYLARRALRLDAEEPTAHNVMGIVALAKGDPVAARRHADRAITAAPMHPETVYMAGVVICGAGDWDGGVSIIRDVVRINPFGPNTRRTWLAMDALIRDDLSTALSEASLVHFPGYVHGHVLRSICYRRMGLDDLAASELEVVLEADPMFLDHAADILGAVPTVPKSVVAKLVAQLPSAEC